MSNPIKQAIESRVSTNYYDPSRQLSDDDIKGLVDQATRAPQRTTSRTGGSFAVAFSFRGQGAF